MRTSGIFAVVAATGLLLASAGASERETKIVLREYLNQGWTHELVTYPFSAQKGACVAESLTLTGPRGPVPVQLSDIEYWPKTKTVKFAKLSWIADLAPLATDTYTVRYGQAPAPQRAAGSGAGASSPGATDLTVASGTGQVEITTQQFGARLLLGEQTYPSPVPAIEVPAPVIAMRLANGTWFGGSAMYGPGKLKAYSAQLTDSGPVFARVTVRYTYANSNTVDLVLRITAGDNTIHAETDVAQHQPDDGFHWTLSRGLPPLIFHVRNEGWLDRPVFQHGYATGSHHGWDWWREIPLNDYTGPTNRNHWTDAAGPRAVLVTSVTPWEDWFSSFTRTCIRLQLQNTPRELQIRSLDPGAWVEPLPIAKVLSGDPDPAKGTWTSWVQKLLPIVKEPNGDVSIQVNAAQGVRKWLVSECLFAADWKGQFQSDEPTSESRPTLGYRLNEVKDMVLDWPEGREKHPRLFVSRADLEAFWKRHDADPAMVAEPARNSSSAGAYLLSGDPEVAARAGLVTTLRDLLAPDAGVVWNDPRTIFLYDAVIDSPLISEAERSLLRARMAYFGYRLSDPAVWSPDRGYCSGNLNMTITAELSRGILACAMPEHPMARKWYEKAEAVMEVLLDHTVAPSGELIEPVGRHGRVVEFLTFAIVSTRSGLRDYVSDPRLKRLMLFFAKLSTPRDPRPRGMTNDVYNTPNRRYLPPASRDPLTAPAADLGMMARFTRESDPGYSAQLQWAWLEHGASYSYSGFGGGFEFVYCDKLLPARTPAWISEVFPRAGAVLRHGLGAPEEHQTQVYVDGYPSQIGSLPSIFAYGKPVAGSFAGSYQWQSDELLTCHVTLAQNGTLAERQACSGYGGPSQGGSGFSWQTGLPARFGERGGWANVSRFSALPRQDYVTADVGLHRPYTGKGIPFDTTVPAWPPVPARGKPPVDWRRQVLFLKDGDPAAAGNYLLIRDTVKGGGSAPLTAGGSAPLTAGGSAPLTAGGSAPLTGQPTMWQMWTVSETVDTPDKVKDVAAVLAAKPGNTILPARELKGDRFTAIGQLGVDVEYFIASPSDTPRHTLRWGLANWDPAGTMLREPEYQDLLHLQMPGDGAYFLAFYPRQRDMAVPAFSTLGNGTIIKVSGEFGTDYGFLSALDAAATGEDASFQGTAGSVQDRGGGLVLALGAKGEVRYKGFGLAADFAASLRVAEKTLTIDLPEKVIEGDKTMEPMISFPGGTVTVTAPGHWALAERPRGVKLAKVAEGFVLEVPAGSRTVTLSYSMAPSGAPGSGQASISLR